MSNYGCKVIVEIVIDLAHKLGLTCVSEGVEDEPALSRLVELGCDTAQGYYISRPISADRVVELLGATVAEPPALAPNLVGGAAA